MNCRQFWNFPKYFRSGVRPGDPVRSGSLPASANNRQELLREAVLAARLIAFVVIRMAIPAQNVEILHALASQCSVVLVMNLQIERLATNAAGVAVVAQGLLSLSIPRGRCNIKMILLGDFPAFSPTFSLRLRPFLLCLALCNPLDALFVLWISDEPLASFGHLSACSFNWDDVAHTDLFREWRPPGGVHARLASQRRTSAGSAICLEICQSLPVSQGQ